MTEATAWAAMLKENKLKALLWDIPDKHIPALDFLRSMAILLVFVTHAATVFQSSGGQYLWFFKLPFIQAGWIGVQLFFVLSGYLIGYQLWKQYQKTFSINYKEFFIKRTLRIWPLYYSICLFFYFTRGLLHEKGAMADLYFLSNYLPQDFIKGSWSLSTEEQFYLLIPLLLYVGGRLKLSLKSWRWILVSLLMLAPLVRYFTMIISFGERQPSIMEIISSLYFPFHTNYDALIFGLLMANIKVADGVKLDWKKYLTVLLVLLPFTIALRLANSPLFNYSFLSVIFTILLWIGLHYQGPVMKLTRGRFFSLIAKLSFCIYLIHYQFLIWLFPSLIQFFAHLPLGINFVLSTGLIFVISIVCSTIFYLLIEEPGMKLRERLLKKIPE